MAINLQDGEIITYTGKLHWWVYFWALVWAVICVAVFISMDRGFVWNFVFSLAAAAPLGIVHIQKKMAEFIITNLRLWIEWGVISRTTLDIPLTKVNDVIIKRSMIQMILNSGNIAIITGNDYPKGVKDLENPKDFLAALNKARAAATGK
jgi:uncharacterized membrane protein YdbT with pleckstrin-like domain